MKNNIAIKFLSVFFVLVLCVSAAVSVMPAVSAAESTVYLRGGFNNWETRSEYAMTKCDDNHYMITVFLKKGNYEYKAGTETWTEFEAPTSGINESISLDKDCEVTFVAYIDSQTIQAFPKSSLSGSVERVVLKSKWMENNDLVLIQKDGKVGYRKAGTVYPEAAYWNIISNANGAFYLQNCESKAYAALSGSSVICENVPSGSAATWTVDTSTGGARFVNVSNQNAVINIENLSGYAKAFNVPIYFTSSQWEMINKKSYNYTLKPDRVEDTGYNAYATSPTSITSYMTGSERKWTQSKDLSAYPTLTAPNSPLAAAVYNLTLEEAVKSINTDSYGEVFYTGTLWQKVWTRDTALSNLYSLAWVFPEISYNCEREKIKTDGNISVFEQDTGTGGSYPVSTDKIITMLSVWETYLADGNKEHLSYFYDVCYNTIMQDMGVAFDEQSGLFMGETCGLDWRDQTYPDWTSETYDSGLSVIAESKTASVNTIYCRVLEIMSKAAKVLNKGEQAEQYWAKMAQDLKAKISERLWNENLGMYSSWEYPEFMGSVLAEKADVLGNGFALWFNIGTDSQLDSIAQNYPLVPYGADVVYPQKQGNLENANKIYHNFGVWPGWESILMVGAGYHNDKALAEEIFNSNVRGAATALTQKEVINYLTGEGVESDQQLWSVAGTLAGYYRVMFGMNYDEDGITFNPYIPEWMEGPFELSNYKYKNAVLDIKISGKGDKVKSFKVDGVTQDINSYVFPTDSTGNHLIEITMENSGKEYKINKSEQNLVVCPEMPEMTYSAGKLTWKPSAGMTYKLWTGKEYVDVSGGQYSVDTSVYGCYSLMAISPDGVCSELSKPITVSPDRIQVQAESGTVSNISYIVSGYVKDYKGKSANLTISVNITKKGRYLLSAVYNNPGDAKSGISCGIRSVYVDGVDKGTLIMPEVFSNHPNQTSTHLALELDEGVHNVKVVYDTANWYDRNMKVTQNNVEYNYFNFDYVGSSEQGSSEQNSSEQNSSEQTSSEQTSSEQTSSEQGSSEQTSSEQSSSENNSSDNSGDNGGDIQTPAQTAKLNKQSLSLKAGQTYTLKVSGGSVKRWESSNTSIATVKNGKVTALKKGSVKITATLNNNDKLTCTVKMNTSPSITIKGKAFKAKTTYTVKKGSYLTLKITGKASTVKNAYSSSKAKVAKVTSKTTASTVKIKGIKKGSATVTVKVNGVAFKVKVKVK